MPKLSIVPNSSRAIAPLPLAVPPSLEKRLVQALARVLRDIGMIQGKYTPAAERLVELANEWATHRVNLAQRMEEEAKRKDKTPSASDLGIGPSFDDIPF